MSTGPHGGRPLLNPMTYVGMARLAKIAAGRHWADGRALSAVTGGPGGCSTGGQAPRSSRCVDTAISANKRGNGGRKQDRRRDLAARAENTAGASTT